MENPEFHPHFLGGTIGIIHNFYNISMVDFRCSSFKNPFLGGHVFFFSFSGV